MQRFKIGRFELATQYRDVGSDRGPAIHLFGPTASGRKEILRFDCFEKEPHYHIAFSYKDLPFREFESESPFDWAKEKIAGEIGLLLEESEAESMNNNEVAELLRVLETLEPERGGDV